MSGALVEGSPESLGRDEISRGRLHKAGDNGYLQKSFDLLTSFEDVLEKRVREVPGNYASGEFVRDTSIDRETNVSSEFTTGNSLLLQEGAVSKSAQIKIAQTFRTGTNDIDALDYVFMYLHDEKQSHSELRHVNDVYVLDNFSSGRHEQELANRLWCCRIRQPAWPTTIFPDQAAV